VFFCSDDLAMEIANYDPIVLTFKV